MPTPQKKNKWIWVVEGTKPPDSIQYAGIGWVYKAQHTFEGETATYQIRITVIDAADRRRPGRVRPAKPSALEVKLAAPSRPPMPMYQKLVNESC